VLRKLLLISLIWIVPTQSWAAVGMSMNHEIYGGGVEFQIVTVPHPCHQENDTEISNNAAQKNLSESNECNSCTLCMVFGLIPHQLFVGENSFSQGYISRQINFVSHNTPSLEKPPIL